MFSNEILKCSKRDFFISNQQRMLVEEEVKKLREKISDLKVENIEISRWKNIVVENIRTQSGILSFQFRKYQI